ncbi:hypothetical protein BDQ17DRAFT_391611 [Cyathus striatus]|nr:hypothetical protein BDQ17DRAFT_391611 [Cyathus striatus]
MAEWIHILPTSLHYDIVSPGDAKHRNTSPPACDELRVGYPGRAGVVAYRTSGMIGTDVQRRSFAQIELRADSSGGVDTCSVTGVDKDIRLAPQSSKVWGDAARRTTWIVCQGRAELRVRVYQMKPILSEEAFGSMLRIALVLGRRERRAVSCRTRNVNSRDEVDMVIY